jgi:dephospho-CoA kinase
MIKVGITGGIGSGKSTLCEIFQEHGAYVLNADNLAKSLMREDPNIKEQIINTFGADAYNKDGSLNREYLAEQAFGKDRVKELNAIVHPAIPAAVDNIMEKAETEDYKMFVYEAALLLQNLRPKVLDHVILVLADQDIRVKRVQERDRVKRELVLDRVEKQQDFEQLKHLADKVIYNNGSLDEFRRNAEKLYYEILTPK